MTALKNKLLIDARGTCQGKTYDAVHTLTDRLQQDLDKEFRQTVLLTPYTVTCEQLLKQYQDATYQLGRRREAGKVAVATFAKASGMMREGDLDPTESLLVFDEMPTFAQFTTWQSKLGDLLAWLAIPELYERITAYGLTATPRLLGYLNSADNLPFEFAGDDAVKVSRKLFASDGLIVPHCSAVTYAKLLASKGFEGAVAIYANNAADVASIYHQFDGTCHKAAMIVSRSNTTKDSVTGRSCAETMNERLWDGLCITDYIAEHEDIPADVDVFVYNAASREGLNVIDKGNRIQTIVVESCDPSEIEQARSRVRHDVQRLVVICNGQRRHFILNNATDCKSFFDTYGTSLSENLLRKRYEEQLSDEMKGNESGARQSGLSCIAQRALVNVDGFGYERYFVNPFILGCLRYSKDCYGLSDECRCDASRLARQLKPLLSGDAEFTMVQGSKTRTSARNASAFERFDMGPWLDRSLTTDDKKRLAASLGLIDNERRPRGWTTVKRVLQDNGYDVVDRYGYFDGKRKRYSTITSHRS